ncbi:unnamed protein product [Meloidogyne enterolobii]|uniref:Uncharacterized protein n=1 Tax=Meloidogyne enterolobii TaxID=390850 RepID=A0ACB1ANL5_MELEN
MKGFLNSIRILLKPLTFDKPTQDHSGYNTNLVSDASPMVWFDYNSTMTFLVSPEKPPICRSPNTIKVVFRPLPPCPSYPRWDTTLVCGLLGTYR